MGDKKRERRYRQHQAAVARVEERVHATLDRISVAASFRRIDGSTVAQLHHALNRARSRNEVTLSEGDAQELVRILSHLYADELRQVKFEDKGGVFSDEEGVHLCPFCQEDDPAHDTKEASDDK